MRGVFVGLRVSVEGVKKVTLRSAFGVTAKC